MISRQRACCSLVHVADRRLDDVPVVLDHRPQRMVEREADLLALGLGERLVEPRHGRLGQVGGRGPSLDLRRRAATAVRPIRGTEAARAPAPRVLSRSRRDSAEQSSRSIEFGSRISAMGAISFLLGACHLQVRRTTKRQAAGRG